MGCISTRNLALDEGESPAESISVHGVNWDKAMTGFGVRRFGRLENGWRER